jgi:predicted SnoaL-like aldol condensation-catalyzing enzyme
MGRQKDAALEFLRMVVARRIREAYAKHVSPTMMHHNPYFPQDSASLMRGMEEAHGKFPNTTIDILHALEDGAFVAVHSHSRANLTLAVSRSDRIPRSTALAALDARVGG